MNRKLKIIFGVVLFTLIATLLPIVTNYFVYRGDQHKYALLMDGDTINVTTSEQNANVGLFTENGDGPTQIVSSSGEVVAVTKEGAMAHYWDLKTSLPAGTYSVRGQRINMIINGDGQVINPKDQARNSASTRNMTILMFFVGLVTGSVSVPVLIRDPNSTDGSDAEADGYAN